MKFYEIDVLKLILILLININCEFDHKILKKIYITQIHTTEHPYFCDGCKFAHEKTSKGNSLCTTVDVSLLWGHSI